MTDIAALLELRASVRSGDIVTRDLAMSAAVGELLEDLIARREAEFVGAARSALRDECRVDAYRTGGEQRVVVTHLPTGARSDAPTVDRALDALPELLHAMGASRPSVG